MPQTDEFGKHEVLHTAHIIASMFDDFIWQHAAVQAGAELKAAAEEIGDKLGDFYQLVGQKSVLAGG